MTLVVSDRSHQYLATQKGELAKYLGVGGSQSHWLEAYQADVYRTYCQLFDEVGAEMPRKVLDIGSGLGGIDVYMIRAWEAQCAMIDGFDAGPAMVKQDRPFCSKQAVDAFMADNWIAESSYSYHDPFYELPNEQFDLVLSLRSWCFHYASSHYIDYVSQHTKLGAYVMLDMRVGKPEWFADICAHFAKVKIIESAPKFSRVLFRKEKE